MSLIPAQYYNSIYIILLGVLSYSLTIRYNSFPQQRLKGTLPENYKNSFWLAVFLVLFIGFRPVDGHVFVDMGGYANFIKNGFYNNMDVSTNFIFDRWRRFISRQQYNVYVFFVSIAAVYFLAMWAACKKLFKADTMLAFLVCLSAFSTFSYGTNGIKAGAAMSIFLLAFAYMVDEKIKYSILYLIISLGFHHSMILPIVAFFVCFFFRKTKYYLWFWFFAFLVALFHITFFQSVFAGIADEKGAGYLGSISSDFFGKRGFRFDFILYSFFPILVGIWVISKQNLIDKGYSFLLNLYSFLNAIWLLCMYSSFTNRIAYLSWGLYPIVLIYPFLRFEWLPNQYKVTTRVVLYHWSFTFFMTFIYYGLLNL